MGVIEELREQYLVEIRAWDWGHIKAETCRSDYMENMMLVIILQ